MVWGEKVMLPGTKAKPLITQGFGVPSDLFWCCHHGDGLHKQLQNNQMKRKEKHRPWRSGVILGTKAMSCGVNMECRNCSFNNHPPFLLWGWTKVWQITGRSPGPVSSGFRKCSQKNRNKWVQTLRFLTHPPPGTLSWALCGVQGWNKANVLWKRGWVWDSRELDLVACPWPWSLSQRRWWREASSSYTMSLGHLHLLQIPLPLLASCYSLWIPDSARPSPESRTSYVFIMPRKNFRQYALLTSSLTLNHFLFQLNPLLSSLLVC